MATIHGGLIIKYKDWLSKSHDNVYIDYIMVKRTYYDIGFLLFQQKIDIREESSDQTAIRIFTTLRVLKYKPPNE